MKKLKVDITLRGDAVDAASLTFSDQDEAYGMREKRSGTILVAAGTAFTKTGTGLYQYDFQALPNYNAGLSYEFWLAVQFSTGVLVYQRGYIPPQGIALPSGYNAHLNAYKINLGDLIQLTRILTDDLDGERYERDFVVGALNDAMVEFAQETGLILEDMTIRVYENVFEYDLPALARADGLRGVIRPERMLVIGKHVPGFYSRSRQTYQQWFGEGLTEGVPDKFSFDEVDPGKFQLNTIPDYDGPAFSEDDQTGNIEVSYRALPVYITEDEEFPDPHIPPAWHDSLPLLAARNLMLDEQDPDKLEKAVDYDSQFQFKVREAGWSAKSMGSEEGLRP